ncbi:MAG: CopD family protein [Acidimicrobiales bacterium]
MVGASVRLGRWVCGAVVAGVLLLIASPALAHTGFESSSPADGDVVDQPVSQITLTFTGEANPVGDGFEVLDADGIIRVPDSVTTADNLTWTLRFDDPLVGGMVGVRWNVVAPDAHPIEGSFSFTVSAPAPTTTTEVPTTTETPTTSTSTTATSTSTTAESAVVEATAAETVDLEEFLLVESDTPRSASLVNRIGRVLSLLGVVGAIGGVVFAAVVLRGDRADLQAVLSLIRVFGALAALGALTEAAATTAALGGGWSALSSGTALGDALWSSFGLAVGLRIIGGAAIAGGTTFQTISTAKVDQTESRLAAVGANQRLSSVARGTVQVEPTAHDPNLVWAIRSNAAAIVGVLLLLVSFLFDGHTVSEGPRWLHALINSVHVAAAATWAGGVGMLAVVLMRRSRRGVPINARPLALRFSVVATVALVAVAAAGTVLAVIILDAVSDVWSTPWGRLLIAKVVLVAAAAVGGGYNHRVLVPELDRAPDNPQLNRRFSTVVTFEAVVLAAVIVVTALLIGASTT